MLSNEMIEKAKDIALKLKEDTKDILPEKSTNDILKDMIFSIANLQRRAL